MYGQVLPHQKTDDIILIAVEGLPGAGKTTLLENLAKTYSTTADLEITFVPEPIDLYTNYNFRYNPLEEIYNYPKENTTMTQIFLCKMLNFNMDKILNDLPPLSSENCTRVLVTDRSLFSPEMFIHTYRSMNFLTQYSEDLLLREVNEMTYATLEKHNIRYSGMIFLDTDIQNCITRISTRGRHFETHVSENFLQRLKIEHDLFARTWKYVLPVGRVIAIDGNREEAMLVNDFKNYLTREILQHTI